MADNVDITPGAGKTIGADELVINGVTVQVQRTKQVLGRDGVFTADLAGRDMGSGDGAAYTDPRNPFVRVQQTPTVSTGAGYAQFDAVGGLLTFANAARTTGFPTILEAATLLDKADTKPPITLVLFNQTFTASADSAAFTPSDADMLNYVGHIIFAAASTDYADLGANSAAASLLLDLPIIPTGTSVFGQLYLPTATVPTFAGTTDIVVSLTFRQQ